MLRRILALATVSFLSALTSTCALATAQRTFVASNGNDANPCSLVMPCRSFGAAIAQTITGGEVIVLDSAGYGPVTITQSVSILAPAGVYAGIAVSAGGTGISINAAFTETIVLRGLTIEGAGMGANGIALTGSGALNVSDCTVRDMTQHGISITPTFGGTVVISDTTVANNNGDGILATASSSGTLTFTLSHVKVINNGFGGSGTGVRLTGLSASFMLATINSTLMSENGTGFRIEASGPDLVTAFITNSNIVNNTKSIFVGASTKIQLEKTSVATNFSGGITNNGTLASFRDNAILDTVTGNAIQTLLLQ